MADTPLEISDLEFWFRGSDCTSSSWPDVTGEYIGAVQSVTFTDGIPTFSGISRATVGVLPAFPTWSVFGYVLPNTIGQTGGFLVTDQGGYNDDILIGLRPEAGAGGDPFNKYCVVHQDKTNSVRTIAYDSIDATPGWASVCATSDGETLRLYVNSDLVASTSRNGAALTWSAGVQTTYIGYNATTSRSWKGLIQHVMAYSRALSGTEILSLHNFVTGVIPPPSNGGNMFLMF